MGKGRVLDFARLLLGVEWALLFHSILSKIVVNITLRWVYEEKNTCRSSNEHWLEAKTG